MPARTERRHSRIFTESGQAEAWWPSQLDFLGAKLLRYRYETRTHLAICALGTLGPGRSRAPTGVRPPITRRSAGEGESQAAAARAETPSAGNGGKPVRVGRSSGGAGKVAAVAAPRRRGRRGSDATRRAVAESGRGLPVAADAGALLAPEPTPSGQKNVCIRRRARKPPFDHLHPGFASDRMAASTTGAETPADAARSAPTS